MNKGKVVLFRPDPSPKPGYKGVPISLLTIAAPLDKANYEVIIIDATAENNFKERILSSAKDSICFGITTMTSCQIKNGLDMAKQVRAAYPEIPIIWGGFHPSIFPEQTAENPYVDIVVRGQGEITFFELVECLRNNKPLDNVLGITYKKGGKIVSNQDRPFEDINKFPPLPLHLINIEKHLCRKFGSRTINYLSSIGCPFRCAFCSDSRVYKRRWSALTAERVLTDLENLVKKYNINGIVFNDDNFFFDKNRVRKICEGIIQKGLNINWGHANGRTDQLSQYEDEIWRLMERSGCKEILIGAESGSQEVLNLIQKDATVEDTIKFAEKCKNYNIKIVYSLMLGLPKTDMFTLSIEKEFKKTLELINRVQVISDNHDIMWFYYTPYPGTPLYEESIKNGFKEPKNFDEWSNMSLWDKTTPWMPEKYIKLLDICNKFIFPCMSNSYKTIDKLVNERFKSLSKIVSFMSILFHRTASFRAKYNFFSFPIEYYLIKLARSKSIIY